MKKMVSLVLCLVISAAVATGCKKQEQVPAAPVEQSLQAEQAPAQDIAPSQEGAAAPAPQEAPATGEQK